LGASPVQKVCCATGTSQIYIGYHVCLGEGSRPLKCPDHADTLLKRNGPGDREKSMSLLDESLAIYSDPGMRWLMDRVLDILKT